VSPTTTVRDRESERYHKACKVRVERCELIQWRNSPDVAIRTHDDERTRAAADAISFVYASAMSAGNIRVVQKDPILFTDRLGEYKPSRPRQEGLTCSSAVVARGEVRDSRPCFCSPAER
jgi:hypothetical protein